MIERASLSRADKWVQWLAIIAGGLGILIIVFFSFLLWLSGDRPSVQFDSGRTGQIGDFIGGVAGSLFALAAGLLFYLTLTLQRREFKNSLAELRTSTKALKRTARNQRESLLIMRQEKEFSVCLQAIRSIESEIEGYIYDERNADAAISRTVQAWKWRVSIGGLVDGVRYGHFTKLQAIDEVFPNYSQLYALHVHLYWTFHAVQKKGLAADDREYLSSHIIPLVQRVGLAITGVGELLQKLSEMNHHLEYQHEQLGLKRELFGLYHKDILKFFDHS